MALLFISFICSAQKPVIFDTDMGNDVDDALALAILHSLSSRGECRLIGVTLTNANPSAAPYIRLVNAFYGRSEIPVGEAAKVIKGGAEDHYLRATLQSAPESLASAARTKTREQGAVPLLRRLLAQSAEKVTIVQVGFSTNLAALLESKPDSVSTLPGIDLVRRESRARHRHGRELLWRSTGIQRQARYSGCTDRIRTVAYAHRFQRI